MTFAPLPGTLIIGIGYKAQHGKTTVARAIVAERPAALVVELSDHVATAARIYHGMTTRDPRVLVKVGQGYRALYGDDVWLRCCYGQIVDKRPPIAIIPNIRFDNEVAFVKALGGVVIHVERFNDDGSPFVATDRDPANVTETALDGFAAWDYRLANKGEAALRRDAIGILRAIERRAA